MNEKLIWTRGYERSVLISCAGTEIKTKRSYPCVRLELKFETCEREYTAGPGLKDGKKRASVLSPGGVISLSQTISVEIVSKIRNFGRLELKFETRKRRNGEKERANSIFGSAGVTKNEFKRVYFSIVSLSASTSNLSARHIQNIWKPTSGHEVINQCLSRAAAS